MIKCRFQRVVLSCSLFIRFHHLMEQILGFGEPDKHNHLLRSISSDWHGCQFVFSMQMISLYHMFNLPSQMVHLTSVDLHVTRGRDFALQLRIIKYLQNTLIDPIRKLVFKQMVGGVYHHNILSKGRFWKPISLLCSVLDKYPCKRHELPSSTARGWIVLWLFFFKHDFGNK